MLVEEPVQVNIEKDQVDIYHWYPSSQHSNGIPFLGGKAHCGHIYSGEDSNYPNGSECVVCAELKRT